MDTGIRVRPAAMSHVRFVAELSGELGYPSSVPEIERRLVRLLADPEEAVFVAEEREGAVVGWVHAHARHFVECDTYAEIGGLVVSSRHRRSGVGHALMRRAEEWAASRGYGIVCLRSASHRKEAHQFYEGIGYRRIKEQHVFQKRLPGVHGQDR